MDEALAEWSKLLVIAATLYLIITVVLVLLARSTARRIQMALVAVSRAASLAFDVIRLAPVPAFAFNLRHKRFVAMNDAARKIGDMPAGRVDAAGHADFFAEMEDRLLSTIGNSTKSGPHNPIEVTARSLTGRQVPGLLTSSMVEVNNETVVLGFFIDLTEHRQALEQQRQQRELLQAVIDAVPMQIAVKNLDLRYVFANRELAKKLGVEPRDIIGKRRDDFPIVDVDPADWPANFAEVASMDRAVIDTGEPILARERNYRRHDGRMITGLASRIPIKGNDGQIAYILDIVVDITDRKAIENDLRAAKDQAEAANRSKSAFLANMSHELRTPLNAVIGFGELMASEAWGPIDNSRYKEYLKDIVDSGRHLLDVIGDILDMSKIEAGKMELDEVEIDVGRMASRCQILAAGRAAERRQTVSLAGFGDLPMLLGDEVRIKQILVNLISNSCKFSPNGSTIKVIGNLLDDGAIAISIVDEGIGMTPQQVARAMQPFQQVGNYLVRSQDGTGLGLPLSKALAELHGATLNVESSPGVGTTVRIVFPPGRTIHTSRAA